MNIAYLNGEKCEDLFKISLYNPSFLYGINVFEGIRSYWSRGENKIFDLSEHIDRLYISANFLGFNVDIGKDHLKKELLNIFEKENIQQGVYIRITFFIGSDTSWSEQHNIHRLISIRSMDSNLNNLEYTTLAISSFDRISSKSMPPSVKAGANYLNSRYALLEANRKGFEGALFISQNNCISESTGSCIFFIRDNKIITPSENSDILVGITRNRIINLCKENNINISEEMISPSQIYSYDAAFLAGTMIEIKPISKIESKVFDTKNNKLFNTIIAIFKNYIYGL